MKQEHPLCGIYKHYKGGYYGVIGIGKHSETYEEVVIYRDVDDEKKIWVRPIEMWFEEVIVEGEKVCRFRKIDIIPPPDSGSAYN